MRFRDRLSLGFGTAACAVSIFAVGGAFRWTQALVAGLVAASLAPQFLSRRTLSRISPLVAALGIAIALTALSLVPLPESVRELLDPVGSGLRADGATLLGSSPWPCLSRDPAGSLHSLTFFVTLLGVAAFALRLAPSERGRYRILGCISIMCGLVAIVVGIHELLGATRLYGVYTVAHAHPSVLGPLLNENHLGSLLAIGACVSAGLAMHARQPTWLRVGWLALVAICAAGVGASGSRGALLALLAGGLVTVSILLAQRFSPVDASGKRRGSFTTRSLPIGIVAVCVVIVAIYSSAGKVSDELGRTTVSEVNMPHSKFAAWKSATKLVDESPWVGVGRGGFESSFTHIHDASGSVTFSYLENEYLQAIVDWGIPGAALFGAALIWFALVALRRWRDGAMTAGALGGLAAIATQSNVDFGIELLGVAVPAIALAATVAYVPLRETEASVVRTRAIRALQLLALVGAALLLVSPLTTSVKEDHETLTTARPSLPAIRASAARHPLDYYAFALAADLQSRAGDSSSIRLLNHAMLLHPTHPDLHRMAARLLFASGYKDQAAIEYAAALRATPEASRILKEIVERFPPDRAAAAIPPTVSDVGAMLRLLSDLHHDDVGTLWLERVVQARPHDIPLCNLVYEYSLGHGDLHAAEVAARHCVELLPDHQTRMSLATLLANKGAHREVLVLLGDVENWTGRIDEKLKAWLMLCDAKLQLQQFDDAKVCLRRLSGFGLAEAPRDITERLEKVEEARRAAELQRAGNRSGAGSSTGSARAP